MIGARLGTRVWAYPAPCDLRKGYNGLYGLVVGSLGQDPLSGDMFVFVNRRRTSCKVLTWDGTGLCIFAKRLERGRFAALWERTDGEAVELTRSELALFLEGCQLLARQALSPEEIIIEPLARRASA